MKEVKAQPTWEYLFDGPIETIDFGRMVYWVLFLPMTFTTIPELAGGRPVRMRGRLGGLTGEDVALAWLRKSGRRYILVSKALAKRIGVSPGSRVTLAFDLVDDEVEVPEEIDEAIRQEPEWREIWRRLTPGQQRAAAHVVSSAKGELTRAKRAVEVFRQLEDGGKPGRATRHRLR